LFRFILLAGLGLVAGFLALAIAVPLEPQIPAPLIALFSPGLKLAEFITPKPANRSPGRLAGFWASPYSRTPPFTSAYFRRWPSCSTAAALLARFRFPGQAQRLLAIGGFRNHLETL
jgi:hypothetical protein